MGGDVVLDVMGWAGLRTFANKKPKLDIDIVVDISTNWNRLQIDMNAIPTRRNLSIRGPFQYSTSVRY
ncbi:hypothetical protein MJO28_012321 [Puccinia striiformis f. sp. tritici]|uniref:Uncharacterized protein n=1 Tax=Puccinia striiformis f. sp. tritici TaxID=168172 RepID=A0ACC0DZJ8_9BASI|nr:hypothetical protein MJO28_012321 [Puccinia striiformis f. sp. tritici]